MTALTLVYSGTEKFPYAIPPYAGCPVLKRNNPNGRHRPRPQHCGYIHFHHCMAVILRR